MRNFCGGNDTAFASQNRKDKHWDHEEEKEPSVWSLVEASHQLGSKTFDIIKFVGKGDGTERIFLSCIDVSYQNGNEPEIKPGCT